VGDYPIRQLVLCGKDFGWMAFWELNPEVLGSLWLKAFATWRGHHFSWRPPWLGKAGSGPFELDTGICLTPEEKHGKPQSGQPSSWRILVAPTWSFFRDSLGWPAKHQPSSVTRGWLQTSLGRHKCLPSCRTKRFSALATLNRNSQSVLWCGRRKTESPNPS
jgi:hypothetical protein